MTVRDDYKSAMIDAAVALRRQASTVVSLASLVEAQVNEAVGASDLGEGPPDVGQMLALHLRFGDIVLAARNAQDEWRRLNGAAQSWSVVEGARHYYADVEEVYR